MKQSLRAQRVKEREEGSEREGGGRVESESTIEESGWVSA
jgi:hypothetical protein